jgi:hypothetical protein
MYTPVLHRLPTESSGLPYSRFLLSFHLISASVRYCSGTCASPYSAELIAVSATGSLRTTKYDTKRLLRQPEPLPVVDDSGDENFAVIIHSERQPGNMEADALTPRLYDQLPDLIHRTQVDAQLPRKAHCSTQSTCAFGSMFQSYQVTHNPRRS